ncbi:WcbI family polysaccharide biosynthesis putative acetyltransferase [Brevundimonas olei]|uniref:WcbI family polysaccharide biosynthesis putative acetyltransferase n=1 Tax=Brevundimonas olei TaxID=657642 RepID=A0ABZ2I967_9CAUL
MTKPVIVCLGNCQSGTIRSNLTRVPAVSANYDVVFTRSAAEFATLRPQLAAVIQQTTHNWADFTVKADDLPSGVALVRYPAALLGWHWPLMPPRSRTADRSPREALFPYTIRDSLVDSLKAKGVTKDELLDAYFSVDLTKRFPLSRLMKIQMEKARQIDAMSDFSIADRMIEGRTMRTANHPDGPLMAFIMTEVIERLPFESDVKDAALERAPEWERGPGIQAVEAPIHPQVIDHFGLEWARNRKWTFWYEGDFTFEEHLLRLYDRWFSQALSEGRAKSKLGEDATDLLAQAVAELPNSLEARAHYSSALTKAGRGDEAIESYVILHAMDPSDANRKRLTAMLRRAGRFDEADALNNPPSQPSLPRVNIANDQAKRDDPALSRRVQIA